jgi:hypothetical protein
LPPHTTIRYLPVHHGQRDKPFGRKWLDVGTDGGKMVRNTDRDRSNPLPARLFAQQWRTHPQGWLSEVIRRLGRHQPGGRVADNRDRPAVSRGPQPCKGSWARLGVAPSLWAIRTSGESGLASVPGASGYQGIKAIPAPAHMSISRSDDLSSELMMQGVR